MLPFINILGKDFPLYSICALLGLFAVMLCVARLARSRGMEIEDPLISILALVVPALVGGALLFGLTNLDHFLEVFRSWDRYETLGQQAAAVLSGFSGIVFYGGLLGAVAGMLLYCKLAKKPVPFHLDMLAVAAPLFHAFGRVGCFLAGCCYGIESPVGFLFTQGTVAAANGAVRFPVQLLEAACNVAIFLVLLWLFRRNTLLQQQVGGRKEPLLGNGSLLYVYFLLYGIVRFLDEFLRGDWYRGFLGVFSTSQWISLILIAVAVGYLAYRRRTLQMPKAPQERKLP